MAGDPERDADSAVPGPGADASATAPDATGVPLHVVVVRDDVLETVGAYGPMSEGAARAVATQLEELLCERGPDRVAVAVAPLHAPPA